MAWRGDEAVVITADVKEQLSRRVLSPSGGGLPQSEASDVSQLLAHVLGRGHSGLCAPVGTGTGVFGPTACA